MILKVTKNQGVTIYLENTNSEKPQGGQIELPPAFLVFIIPAFLLIYRYRNIIFFAHSIGCFGTWLCDR